MALKPSHYGPKNKIMFRAIGGFVYKYSGIEAVVSMIQSALLRYRLRIKMVPVSYKLFVLILVATIGGSAVFIHEKYPSVKVGTIVIENTLPAIAQAKEAKAPEIDQVDKLADYIWFKESTRGKKNYSQCEVQGLINGTGYMIPGNGKYICFQSHEEEMQVVKGWIITKKAQGYSDKELLCTYNQGDTNGVKANCEYSKGF